LPRASTCDNLAATEISLRQIEGQALERDSQIHTFELHIGRHFQCARREIEDRFNPPGDHLLDNGLGMRCGNRDDCDVEPFLARYPFELADVINGDAAARFVADFLVCRVEQGGNLEAFLTEAGVVGQRKAEVAGAHDGYPQMTVQPQNLTQMAAQILDVVTDAANAELAEIREVFADLRGVQVELLGERLGGNGLDTGGIKLVQAAQIDGQAIGGQFRHLIGGLTPLVRPIHKRKWYCKVLELAVGARSRTYSRALCTASAALVLLVAAIGWAQPAPRRVATIAGLRQFPSFFHMQNVLLRGEFKEEGPRIFLNSEDGNIRSILDSGVHTTSGAVEVRGQLIDVGRLEPGDPRVPDAETRDTSRWPRPGEELFVRVTAIAPAAPPTALTIRGLALEPWRYAGQKVTVTGNFRGRNLFGDLPGSPGKSRYDFVVRGAEGATWVTGLQPRGRGFDLDVDRRLDTDQWLEVTGVVAYERGLVRIDATELAAAAAPQVLRLADEPAAPPPQLPPLEVVFSTPTPEEEDVSPTTTVRIQLSKGVDPRSIAGAIRARYVDSNAAIPAFQTSYDGATRALTMRFLAPLEHRRVQISVGDTLKGFDGAPAIPWTLTFTVGE